MLSYVSQIEIRGLFSCEWGKPPFQAEEQCDQETLSKAVSYAVAFWARVL